MKKEFVLAFNEVLEDKQLPKEIVLEALKAAMVSAYRRAVNASNAQDIEAKIDMESGKVTIFAEKEIVETVQDSRTEVSLDEAHEVDPEVEEGEIIVVESTPDNFGRVAAQTARQVIQQRIREAEREVQFSYFSDQVGEILSGIVQAINPQVVTLGLDKGAEGIMPRNQQIPGERLHVHDRVRALLLEVKSTPRGPQIILSRSHRNFLLRLLENEVPEIYHGLVEIRSIAREPGHRSKVAVSALQSGVDPVGACVGIRGVRIQAIVRELNDEKIDVIEWNPDATAYIAKALSPARVSGVYLNKFARGTKTATVVVPEDQLSLAIGRNGQNARLAAKLASWRIDIKSLTEAATDALHKLQSNIEYAELAQQEVEAMSVVELILAKKAEGRPVTPEEYKSLSQFVDRVEKHILRKHEQEIQAEEELLKEAQSNVPETAYDVPLEEVGLSTRVFNLLDAEDYKNAGRLMLQLNLDVEKISGIKGLGEKSVQEIEETLNGFEFPEPEEEVPVIPEEEPESEIEGDVPESKEEKEVEEPEEGAKEITEEVTPVEELKEEITEETKPSEIEEDKPEDEAEEELDELFKLPSKDLEKIKPFEEEKEIKEREQEEQEELEKKRRKRKKYIEVEYDPEHDVTIKRKKRKKGRRDWEDDINI